VGRRDGSARQRREAIRRRDHGGETLAEAGSTYNASGWTISGLLMSDWSPVAILPNLPAKQENGCEVVAFVSRHDPRVQAFCAVQPKFKEFLLRFTDVLGRSSEPVFIVSASTSIPNAGPKLLDRAGHVP
jgi:hypothetical protein